MTSDRFSRQIVDAIAKRAGNICSNPDCQSITVGPAEETDRSVTLGEAAHIFGANPGSARYDPAMSSAERSDITNAIWLCRNCHKLIDVDVKRFSVSILFEWRRLHERLIVERIGKPGDLIRQKMLTRELEEFKDCGYLAQQIVIDKPDFWEYKLTAELLRHNMRPVLSRWHSLEKGLYANPLTRIDQAEMMDWYQDRIAEASKLVGAMGGLINGGIQAAWGEPGVPGSEAEILRVCNLIVEVCQRLLDWEERVQFASVPSIFEEVRETLKGISGRLIDKLAVLPVELAKPFEQENPSGVFKVHIDIDLPEGWPEKVSATMQAAVDAMIAEM